MDNINTVPIESFAGVYEDVLSFCKSTGESVTISDDYGREDLVIMSVEAYRRKKQELYALEVALSLKDIEMDIEKNCKKNYRPIDVVFTDIKKNLIDKYGESKNNG